MFSDSTRQLLKLRSTSSSPQRPPAFPLSPQYATILASHSSSPSAPLAFPGLLEGHETFPLPKSRDLGLPLHPATTVPLHLSFTRPSWLPSPLTLPT